MVSKNKRLASLFGDFAERFELDHKVDADGQGATLGIPDRGRLITTQYVFHPSDDSYEYGAALGQVEKRDIPRVSSQWIQSPPIRGVTPHITNRGSFYVLGSRDGLSSSSDGDIQKGFMDDVARVSRSSDVFRGISRKRNERRRKRGVRRIRLLGE